MKSQRVGQRPGFRPPPGAQHAGRFCWDDHGCLRNNIVWECLREGTTFGQAVISASIFIGRSPFVGSFCDAPIDHTSTVFNQALKTRAAPASWRSANASSRAPAVCFVDDKNDEDSVQSSSFSGMDYASTCDDRVRLQAIRNNLSASASINSPSTTMLSSGERRR